jgi:hypothetical protein
LTEAEDTKLGLLDYLTLKDNDLVEYYEAKKGGKDIRKVLEEQNKQRYELYYEPDKSRYEKNVGFSLDLDFDFSDI